MAKIKYDIKQSADGIVTLNIGGVTVQFKSREQLNKFALELQESIHDRWVGKYKLQDTDDGKLMITISKATGPIVAKDYEQAMMFAQQLYEDTAQ